MMKLGLGRTLRQLRQGKHISLSSIADDYLSKSQISRFERGESEITCARLINILDKLNVSLDEFLVFHNKDHTDTEIFRHLVHYIRQEYSANRIDNLVQLLSDTSQYQLSSFEKTMIKSIIFTHDSSFKPSEEEIGNLTDYLFQVEKWGYYEMILLGNCMTVIEYNSFFLLTQEMLNAPLYASLCTGNQVLITQLAINCLFLSIDQGKAGHSIYLINKIKELLENSVNFYEKTVFLYARGYFEYKIKKETSTTKMRQAIQVFDLLEEENLKRQYSKHYQEHTQGKTILAPICMITMHY